MNIDIKKTAVFVILPLLLMSFALSVLGTSHSLVVSNHYKVMIPAHTSSESLDSCKGLICQARIAITGNV